MKRAILMGTALMLLAGAWGAETKTLGNPETKEAPHRKIYAYFQSNFDFGGNYGLGSFYADSPEETQLEVPFSYGIYAGAAANGVFYGFSYEYMTAAPPVARDMMAVNLRTGETRYIGPWEAHEYMKPVDMTYSYADSAMLALDYWYEYCEDEDGNPDSYLACTLWEMDLKTAQMEKRLILDTSAAYSAVAANYEGEIFLMGNDGILYDLDEETGKVTAVCTTPYSGPDHRWSMEFDHTDGSLYLLTMARGHEDEGAQYHLVRFDMQSTPVTYEELGGLGNSVESEALAYGLYIPYVLAGEDAPAAPTALSVEPDAQGALKATLKWTTPELTFGGDALSGLSAIKVFRDGVEIAEVPATENGKAMEWVDENVPELGFHEYALCAVNAEGDGEMAYVNRYVGPDIPAKVTNLKVGKVSGCAELHLSWTASEGGENGSYVDPAGVTYEIRRYPDSVTIAEGLKETSFVDNTLENLAGYTYEVFACNEIGSSSVLSSWAVAGPAMLPPYRCEFSEEEILTQWTVEDGNEDAWGWMFNSFYGLYQFGDYVPAAEYLLNPSLGLPQMEYADEWLIGPPLALEGGMKYRISFDYRCVSDEVLEITLGKINTYSDQSTVGELSLPPASPYTEFGYQEMEIPVTEKGIYSIGMHLVTPVNSDFYSHLQITNILVEEAGPLSVEDTDAMADVNARYVAGEIRVDGEFDHVEVYGISGQKILSTTSAVIPVDFLPQGVYLVRIYGTQGVKTVKVLVF